jgi:hypothetical protein
MPEYLTACESEAGRNIEADSWEDAEDKLRLLVYFGLVHPKTKIVGVLEEEYDTQA